MSAVAGKRRVDVLRYEADHARLSPHALTVGREIQAVLEQAHAVAGSGWAERVDTSARPDAAALHGLEAARRAVRTMERVRLTVGTMDARIVQAVLGSGQTFDQVAATEGKTGARAITYIASRFRDALEEVARATQARGKVTNQFVDKYSTQADRLRAT